MCDLHGRCPINFANRYSVGNYNAERGSATKNKILSRHLLGLLTWFGNLRLLKASKTTGKVRGTHSGVEIQSSKIGTGKIDATIRNFFRPNVPCAIGIVQHRIKQRRIIGTGIWAF